MPESRTSPRRIKAVERQRQAIELRLAGATFSAIARALGYATPYGAQMAVEAGLKKVVLPSAAEYLKLDTRRLDDLLMAVWAQAKAGQLEYWDRALKAIEARARRLGLVPEERPGAMAAAAAQAVAQVQVLIQTGQSQQPVDIGVWRRAIVEGNEADRAP